MSKLFYHMFNSAWKEMLLLKRDSAGLIVLFLMPAALVIIITLVQENVMELTGEKSNDILFIDRDHGSFGIKLREILEESGRIRLIETQDSTTEAIKKVTQGDYQVCIMIKAGTSTRLTSEAKRLFNKNWTASPVTPVPIYFDPSVLPGFRSGIIAMLQLTVFKIEMEAKIGLLEKKAAELHPARPPGMDTSPEATSIDFSRLQSQLLAIKETQVGETLKTSPSAVQHNIPAWSLFGLFFTCIPLAGSLLLERNSGIWIRLLSQPVSPLSLLLGKIIGYVAVCFCQIALIVLIGRFLFPYLGLPSFILSGDISSLLLISFCCSLAACGYGIFLGSICNSMEQASMFGSISIVIAAALGGTMVPTYAMPAVMQRISLFSPLNWGLSAFQDVLLRGFSLPLIQNNLLKLLLFFSILLLLSWQLNRQSK